MKFLKNAVAELYSLFVDDPWFAAALIAWTAAVYYARPVLPAGSGGLVFFGGLSILLLGFTYRQAFARRKG